MTKATSWYLVLHCSGLFAPLCGRSMYNRSRPRVLWPCTLMMHLMQFLGRDRGTVMSGEGSVWSQRKAKLKSQAEKLLFWVLNYFAFYILVTWRAETFCLFFSSRCLSPPQSATKKHISLCPALLSSQKVLKPGTEEFSEDGNFSAAADGEAAGATAGDPTSSTPQVAETTTLGDAGCQHRGLRVKLPWQSCWRSKHLVPPRTPPSPHQITEDRGPTCTNLSNCLKDNHGALLASGQWTLHVLPLLSEEAQLAAWNIPASALADYATGPPQETVQTLVSGSWPAPQLGWAAPQLLLVLVATRVPHSRPPTLGVSKCPWARHQSSIPQILILTSWLAPCVAANHRLCVNGWMRRINCTVHYINAIYHCPLHTNASARGMEAVLSQEVDGEERPVINISRKLDPRKSQYGTIKECLMT